jgi:hypothetical protein
MGLSSGGAHYLVGLHAAGVHDRDLRVVEHDLLGGGPDDHLLDVFDVLHVDAHGPHLLLQLLRVDAPAAHSGKHDKITFVALLCTCIKYIFGHAPAPL